MSFIQLEKPMVMELNITTLKTCMQFANPKSIMKSISKFLKQKKLVKSLP
jgi:hypothetical protein